MLLISSLLIAGFTSNKDTIVAVMGATAGANAITALHQNGRNPYQRTGRRIIIRRTTWDYQPISATRITNTFVNMDAKERFAVA